MICILAKKPDSVREYYVMTHQGVRVLDTNNLQPNDVLGIPYFYEGIFKQRNAKEVLNKDGSIRKLGDLEERQIVDFKMYKKTVIINGTPVNFVGTAVFRGKNCNTFMHIANINGNSLLSCVGGLDLLLNCDNITALEVCMIESNSNCTESSMGYIYYDNNTNKFLPVLNINMFLKGLKNKLILNKKTCKFTKDNLNYEEIMSGSFNEFKLKTNGKIAVVCKRGCVSYNIHREGNNFVVEKFSAVKK